jgi:sialic acid synthase SpsE
MMAPHIRISERLVGRGNPVYVIAELSANHNRNFKHAVEIIRAAKCAGADAVKLQTYTPDTITIRSDRECFRIGGGTLWDGRTLYDLYGEAYTPWDWQPKLKLIANELGLDLFSSAFDATAVDFLEDFVPKGLVICPQELLVESRQTLTPLSEECSQRGLPDRSLRIGEKAREFSQWKIFKALRRGSPS